MKASLINKCLDRLKLDGLVKRCMDDLLSWNSVETSCDSMEISFIRACNHMIVLQHSVAAMISASVEDVPTICCFKDLAYINDLDDPNEIQYPVWLCPSGCDPYEASHSA
jgi:hypothetical protein